MNFQSKSSICEPGYSGWNNDKATFWIAENTWFDVRHGREIFHLKSVQTEHAFCELKWSERWTNHSLPSKVEINPLASELFFFNFSAPVYKMWIIQEPNKLALWNKLHFEEKKTESIEHV